MSKFIIYTGASIGGLIGSLIPMLWGDDYFSLWSIVLSAVGGVAGIILGYKISRYF